MKTTALILSALFGAAAAIKCETLSFDTSCCSLDPVQPKGGYGSVLQNYVCTDCVSWGNFNQTFMQAYGAFGDLVPSAASYVGTKGSGMGFYSNTDVKGVQSYKFTHSNGKCTSTLVTSATQVVVPVSICYEDTPEDCRLG